MMEFSEVPCKDMVTRFLLVVVCLPLCLETKLSSFEMPISSVASFLGRGEQSKDCCEQHAK